VQNSTCDTSQYVNRYGFENDLYGTGRIWLRLYSEKIDRFMSLIDLESFTNYYDLECIREKEVKFPELRDRLLELVQDPEVRYQKLIVLLKGR
jgi:methyl coenzyme M reductase subunit C-like uncharacterized protein (methanogenesis marker protein 7)